MMVNYITLNYWTEPTVSEMEYIGDDDDNDDDYYYDDRDSTSSFYQSCNWKSLICLI